MINPFLTFLTDFSQKYHPADAGGSARPFFGILPTQSQTHRPDQEELNTQIRSFPKISVLGKQP
jgi:hypothetical protein